MYILLETLLLNILFLLFPIVVFLIFFEDTLRSYHKLLFILLSSTTMFLCMTYPIQLEVGFIFDLRFIPFILIALFGGYKMAFPLYLILNIYRLVIGGNGIIQSLLFSTVIFLIVPLFHKWFIKLKPKKRIIYATFFSFFTIVLYLSSLSLQIEVNGEFWILTSHALATHIVVMLIMMIFIEQIIRNIKARKLLVHTEKLNLMSELSASVAHEIRNPLTVTNGFLQLLKESKTITPSERKYLEYGLQELERAEEIVSDFLAFAKPQSENMVYSNFRNETEYGKNVIFPYAKMHQVDVQFTFQNTLCKKYDKNQVQQCFINLYKNGVEAMKEKGGTLYIDVFEQKNKIMIKIQDTGVGMTKDEMAQIGKPYYSTKTEGTGLGMLMVYSTIHKMKGKIEVESEKGNGTIFLISIPV